MENTNPPFLELFEKNPEFNGYNFRYDKELQYVDD